MARKCFQEDKSKKNQKTKVEKKKKRPGPSFFLYIFKEVVSHLMAVVNLVCSGFLCRFLV